MEQYYRVYKKGQVWLEGTKKQVCDKLGWKYDQFMFNVTYGNDYKVIRISKPSTKLKVQEVNSGKVFDNVKAAANYFGIDELTIHNILSGKIQGSKHGLKFIKK